VVRDGRAHRVDVETGIMTPTRAEIVSGLREGDQVAIPGQQPLTEGTRVRPES